MKHFLSVQDVDNPLQLAKKALDYKKHKADHPDRFRGKSVCLLFFNSSLRTRLSTQRAAANLGIEVSIFNVSEDGWQLEFEEGVVMSGSKAEHIKEAAAVMGRYFDVLGVRAFASLKDRRTDYEEQVIESFRKYAGIPILNLESSTVHPLQSLADIMTILENKKQTGPRILLTWAPHPRALPQAVANSFSEWVLKAGFELTISHPKGYELDDRFTQGAHIEYDPDSAYEGVDFVYAKNWSSYETYGEVLSQDPAWMVTEEKMRNSNDAFFMHCLPVRRNVVVSDGVLDGGNSLVLDQAENRIYAAQAAFYQLLHV